MARGPVSAALWSLTWAVGVGLGVAGGAYLTVTSSAAAPGESALGSTELAVLPLASAAAVFVVMFVAKLLVQMFRRRRAHHLA